jgi:hypothetical protein
MVFFQKNWVKISILNLVIVAFLGVIMRYKIAFDFPFLDQKNVLHSHSHFAFSGWITQTLFLLMTYFLEKRKANISTSKYHYILLANLVCSYGMLVSFILHGYSTLSIIFSTLSIFISFIYSYCFVKDTKILALKNASINWFRGALFFNVISSFGTFFLAYMMANKEIVQDLYLSSIYFYLHFQYNGWFFFAIVGLFLEVLKIKKISKKLKVYFWGLFFSCIVTYFLSILWVELPFWVHDITVVFTLLQTFYWFSLQSFFIKHLKEKTGLLKQLLLVIGIAANLKFLMQLGLVFPKLNTIVFGTRIIVIAYLHLVLLGIITLFLLYYLVKIRKIVITKVLTVGTAIFVISIILNEVVLFSQGALSFFYILFPFANELLFAIGVFLFVGISMILYAVSDKKIKRDIPA